jgi:hypothetical protein
MTIFSSRNFIFSFWIISLFLEFKTADDHSTDSKTKKTKANKLSIDELMKTQTKEQEVKITSFSISDFFFLTKENDTDDWFTLTKFSKIEEKIEDATDSKTNNRKRIKIESQNSQWKWTSFDTENSAKRQTTHTNSFLRFFSKSNSDIYFQSSSFRDDNESKNSTEQINKQSKSFR